MQACLDDESVMQGFVGVSPQIQRLRAEIARLAAHDVSILLQGETGTGKELVAHLLHRLSVRRGGPFIGVNCVAIHETLLESELFGHEAGAFTGARHATLGFFRAADGGTILLDEVGDMGGALQSKLLRVLEDQAVVPVGATKPVPINVRVLSATHRDLAEAVRNNVFRQDLYYRLSVVTLKVPPLRERRADIPVLARHMLGRIAAALEVAPKTISHDAIPLMVRYDWPGNVRQLGNVIQRAYVLGDGPVIDVADLPPEIRGDGRSPHHQFPTLREAMGRHVARALELSGGVRSRAARMLEIDRKTLRRMMARQHLS
jgi:two-component system response regulator GlrR